MVAAPMVEGGSEGRRAAADPEAEVPEAGGKGEAKSEEEVEGARVEPMVEEGAGAERWAFRPEREAPVAEGMETADRVVEERGAVDRAVLTAGEWEKG